MIFTNKMKKIPIQVMGHECITNRGDSIEGKLVRVDELKEAYRLLIWIYISYLANCQLIGKFTVMPQPTYSS